MPAGRTLLYGAAALSMVAGLVHLAVAPEHWEEWWGYGLFFFAVAAAQVLYAPILLRSFSPAWVWAGIVGNGLVIALYIVTRTVGIPFGPEAGEVEEVAAIDLLSKGTELLLMAVLGVLLVHRRSAPRPGRGRPFPTDTARDRPGFRLESP